MRRIPFMLVVAAALLAAQPPAGAQPRGGRGTSGGRGGPQSPQPGVKSPEVSADGRVTFRVRAPQAQSV